MTGVHDTRHGVTVVITAHQLAAYLPACLDGLLRQTCQDFDVLLLDDASSDGTAEVARAYQKRMPGRFCIQTLERNTGMAAKVRNMALDSGLVRGDYALFLDGDDELSPDFIARMLSAARKNDADMTICAFDRMDADGKGKGRTELGWLAQGVEQDAGGLAFVNTALWNKLIKREVMDDARMPPLRIGEDAVFLLSIYGKCKRFAFVPEPLIHYRVHAASAMTRTDMRGIAGFGEALAALYEKPDMRATRETIAAAAFIHIGLSMASRAATNTGVTIHAFTAWANALFQRRFNHFTGVRALSAKALFKRGGPGMGIWLAKWLYRLGLAPVMLWLMRALSRCGFRWTRW